MFRYALKRLVRGRSIFLVLFLSVALAATLFSGIMQAADAVGASMLNKALEITDIDIVSSAENRNLTATALNEVNNILSRVDYVESVEYLFRSDQIGPGEGMEVNISGVNGSMPYTFVAINPNSTLMNGFFGVDELEYGKIYVERGSLNASFFTIGDTVTLSINTYNPGSAVLFRRLYKEMAVGEFVEVDTRLFSVAMGQYATFLRSVLTGTGEIGRRPPHRLIFMREDTFLDWMNEIYSNWRRHTRVIVAENVITLDRGALLNAWSIEDSIDNVENVWGVINNLGASLQYVPVNYLGGILESIKVLSGQQRTNTILVALPVFFTAWYLGMTVSEISMSLRRREIALLFTRGLTHKQVFYIFLFEALIVGLVAGVSGILLGAFILPLVMPSFNFIQVLFSMSPVTLIASIGFSCTLAIVAVYSPSRKALKLNIVDALREYQSEEESESGSWHEPVLALSLGIYRVAMLAMHLTVEHFRPSDPNFIVSILYATWWGTDYLLSYIAPILLFWGLTTLFIRYFPWFHNVLGGLSGRLAGDIAIFSTISARRNIKRTVASTFLAALILGYGVSVIGGMASTYEYNERLTGLMIGADASVWLFSMDNAESIRDRVVEVEGVAGATVEIWLDAPSYLGDIPVRMIDPLEFKEIAYLEEGWLWPQGALDKMNESETYGLLERGIAEIMDVPLGTPWLIKVGNFVKSFGTVGFFGREAGPAWTPQDPTLYISKSFYIKETYMDSARILVKFDEGADTKDMKSLLESVDPNIERVDVAAEVVSASNKNVIFTGSMKVGQMGVYFAALVSSLGVAIVIFTTIRSRWKEITVMAIRGFSNAQLTTTLLVESLGMVLFAVVVGTGVGFVMMWGETEVYNVTIPSLLVHHTVFPLWAQLTITAIIGLLVVSTVLPIVLAVRNASNNPTWRTHE